MAKKLVGKMKLQIPAGQANPSPPVGPALGQRGTVLRAHPLQVGSRVSCRAGLFDGATAKWSELTFGAGGSEELVYGWVRERESRLSHWPHIRSLPQIRACWESPSEGKSQHRPSDRKSTDKTHKNLARTA